MEITEEIQGSSPLPRGLYSPPKEYIGVNDAKYYLIQTVPQFMEMLRLAAERTYLSVDTEGTGLRWAFAHACGISIGWGAEHNYYIPFMHRKSLGDYDGPTDEKQISRDVVVKELNKLFSDDSKIYFMANAKHDVHVLNKEGIFISGVIHDIVIMSNLIDENGSHGVKELATKFIHSEAGKWETLLKHWRLEEAKRRKSYLTEKARELVAKYKQDEDLVMTFRLEVLNEPEKRKVTNHVNKRLKGIAVESLSSEYYFKYNKIADISYDYVPLDIMAPYACSDVHYTYELGVKYLSEVKQEPDLVPLYIKENNLSRALISLEWTGIKIDRGYLEQIGPDLDARIVEARRAIFEDVGSEFNVGSTNQLRDVLLAKGVDLVKITKGSQDKIRKGEISPDEAILAVDSEVLEELAIEHPFVGKIIDFREALKLKSTYRDNLLNALDENDIFYPSFNQNVRTGRMSSSGAGVNVQTIGDKLIKRAFTVPSDEYIFVFIDYSQIELRILAHLSQDPNLLACYPWVGEGTDVHTKTAAEAVLGISVEDFLAVYDNQDHPKWFIYDFARKAAKRVNFGIGYGANKYTIQRQISTPDHPVDANTCQGYIDGFFENYKYVKKMIARTNQFLHKHDYVQNEAGRYRRFPGTRALVQEMEEIKYRKDPISRARKKELFPKIARAERQANNFLIQGYAADIFKESVVRVDRILKGKKSRICNLVHDEMQFYFHKSELGLLKEVKRVMEDYDLSVPLRASVAYSQDNWANKRELKLAA